MKSIVVGFGRIANSIRLDKKISGVFRFASHAQVLHEHPKFDWIGVVDPAKEAREAAKFWDIRCGELEDFRHAEFAVLTIPPEARLDAVRKLPRLKAVMIEKPMGNSGEAFLKYCRSKNIAVTVNFWRRGVPLFQELAGGGLARRIGRTQAVFCTYGNGLRNNGSHLIDFIHMLFGDVVEIHPAGPPATVQSTGCSGQMDDYHAAFTLRMRRGFDVAVLPVDFNKYREVSVDVWGDKGRLGLYQESLRLLQFPLVEHRAMERQKEIASDLFEVTNVDVSEAFYNLYTSIAEGRSLSPGDGAIKTEHVLKGIIG